MHPLLRLLITVLLLSASAQAAGGQSRLQVQAEFSDGILSIRAENAGKHDFLELQPLLLSDSHGAVLPIHPRLKQNEFFEWKFEIPRSAAEEEAAAFCGLPISFAYLDPSMRPRSWIGLAAVKGSGGEPAALSLKIAREGGLVSLFIENRTAKDIRGECRLLISPELEALPASSRFSCGPFSSTRCSFRINNRRALFGETLQVIGSAGYELEGKRLCAAAAAAFAADEELLPRSRGPLMAYFLAALIAVCFSAVAYFELAGRRRDK